MPAGKPLGCQTVDNSSAANDTAAHYSPLRYSSLVDTARIIGTRVARMFVPQSPRRHSARLQNASEDGTDEDEQDLLQPEDRPDRRSAVRSACRSSPQDQQPRHTQLHASSRIFADPQFARHDARAGPGPNAPVPAHNAGGYSLGTAHADPAHNAGEAIFGTSYADPAHNAGEAPLPPSLQPRYQSYTRTSEAHGTYIPSNAAREPADTSSHADQHHRQRTPITLDPVGGRVHYNASSFPDNRDAELDRKCAFYRNAEPYKNLPWTVDPLPPLELPTFDGDIRKYWPFRHAFDEAVGNNPAVRPVEKLLYLWNFLRGKPLEFAKEYMPTDSSYDLVIGALDFQYRKELLCHKLYDDLTAIRPPSKEIHDLRRFHREVRVVHTSLQYVEKSLDGDRLAETALVHKLPTSVCLELLRHYGYPRDSCNATAFLRCLEKYCDDAEWCERTDPFAKYQHEASDKRHTVAVDTSDLPGPQCRDDPEPPDLPGPQCRNDPEPSSIEPTLQRAAAAVATTTANERLQERRTCPLCGLLHSAADCKIYATTNRRLRRAMKLNLCLLCLREGHPAVSCPRRTTRPCNICRRGQHNRAFCKDADDHKRRRDRHPSQVRATRDSRRDPEASDQQRNSRPSAPAKPSWRIAEQPVNREATCCVATATTLRPSGTQSSRERSSGNLINRKKRTKDLGTPPPGRSGTNRPPTTSTDESIKHDGAGAYGRDRLLPGRDNHLQTDTCSTNREMMQFDQPDLRDGSDSVHAGVHDTEDEVWLHELFNDEDASHQPSDGPFTDAAPGGWSVDRPDDGFPPNEESTAYAACASDSDEQPAVLHECLAVTAMNPASKKSRRAVIMFDSGTTYSHVSSKLARDLDLPHGEMRVQNVSTFGSKTPMAINGFRTFLVLRSAHGRCLQVNVTVANCIVSSVRTALINNADLPALRRNDCQPTSIREMPDLLIGQDLVHLFNRRHKPTLPSGFYVVRTSMGPTIGGASRCVTPQPRASLNSRPHAALLAAEDAAIAHNSLRRSHSSTPFMPERSTSCCKPRLSELFAYRPADNTGDTADSLSDVTRFRSAHNAGETVVYENNESDATRFRPAHNAGETVVHDSTGCLEPSTSTSFVSRQPSTLFRVSGALPHSPQKQLSTIPLDTQPLPLPTSTYTYVEVNEIPLAHNAGALEPNSGTAHTFDFVKIPPVHKHAPPAHNAGGQAASPATCKKPAHNAGALRTDPGIAQKSTSRKKADDGRRSYVEIHVFTDGFGYAYGLTAYLRVCGHAVLLPTAWAAVLYGLFRSALRQHVAILRHCTLEWTGSYHDCLRWLRSSRSLPTHARGSFDRPPQVPAHQQPPPPGRRALNSVQLSGPQPTPQPPASQPARPPPACLPHPLPASVLSCVRIDSHPTRPSQGPAAETLHCCPLCLPTPAACRISSRFSVLVHLSTMIRRKQNKITILMDFPAVPPGSAFHRAHEPTPSSLPNEPTMDDRQRASVPAHNAGLVVSATRTRAKAKTSVTSAHNAGSQAIAKDEGRTPGRCKTPPSTTQQVTTTKPAHGPATPRKLGANRLPAPAKEKRSSATAKPAAPAKPPATKQPKRSPGHRAYAQASPSGPQCRSVNLSCGTSGHSRGSGPQCRSSRIRTREPAQAPPRVLTAAAPPNCRRRGPRADRFDQELPAAVPRSAASNYVQTTLRRAARAAQEPLESMAPAPVPSQTLPRRCAFCGQLHQSRDCDVYATTKKRLGRTRHLRLCFSCLGQGHCSSSCCQNASVCAACYAGQHNEAFCRHVPTTPSAHGRAPTVTTPVAAAPQRTRRRSSAPPATTNMRRACAFCQSPHWSANCTTYARVSQRVNRARKLELCFICLRNGHHVTSCPSRSTPCMFCSKGSHHRSLSCHATMQSSDSRADGVPPRKKRVSTSSVRVNDRNDCPPKNETICFCDASTFQQFGRQLRPGVQMIETPTSTQADVTNFVCSFRPASEVKRVIFWFSSDRASLNHVELVRLVTELSHYYATHYESILQYVVVSPSVSSRQDAWTYGIFKCLVQAQVLLLDARLSMLPYDLLVSDHNDHQAIDVEEPPSFRHPRDGTPNSSNAFKDVKHCLREQFQLDLWSYYYDARSAEPATDKVAAHNAASATPSTACEGLAAAHNAVASVPAQPPISASTAKQNLRVQDSKAATDARVSSKTSATPDAATSPSSHDASTIAASAASQAVNAPATGIEVRIAQLSADLAALKDLLPKPTVRSGPLEPTRPPDTDPEKDA